MKERIYLVRYTHYCGDHEFSGKTVLSIRPRQKIETEVHEFFLNYYNNLESVEQKDAYYTYNFGEVAIRDIEWERINSMQREVLTSLNIA